jgi:uncharacterized membrane protein
MKHPLILPALIMAFLVIASCSGYGPYSYGHYGMGYHRYGYGGWIMGIIWILIIAAIAFGIYFLVRGRAVRSLV